MFSSPEKPFDLPIYAEAMARASPPTRPCYNSCSRNVDLRIVEYFDIDASVDASIPVDYSDPECNYTSGTDVDATVDASFPLDSSDSESNSLSGTIFQ